MPNIKEVLRRLAKYIILILCIGFIIKSLSNNRLYNKDIFIICMLSGLTYCILDMISPSINLVINKEIIE
jgi:hypothetical protein